MVRMYEEQRGRPGGRAKPDHGVLESMVWIAYNNDLDPVLLVNTLFEALENKVSHCGGLEISCRNVTSGYAMFLITKGEKVVWQFPINLDFLSRSDVVERIKEVTLPKKVAKSDIARDLDIC